jgi:hypothetical protein
MRYSAAMRLFVTTLAAVVALQPAAASQSDQPIQDLLKLHQYDLAGDGRALLEKEAKAASFLLIGGLHGDKETPALVDSLWPTIGYGYLAAEMSPWAASRLKVSHIRGSDIEEPQPHSLIAAGGAEPSEQSAAIDGGVDEGRIQACPCASTARTRAQHG